MERPQVLSVYMTFPNEEEAARIARVLIDERLVACVNLLPAGRSLYRWEGAVEDEPEFVAFAKTTSSRVESVVERVLELHSYETPCVVALPVAGGSPAYLAWVAESVAP